MDKQPHLLVVDDDREIRNLISQFLTKHGYRVSSAANGAEMMQVLNTSRIDLIVLDLMMPGEDGLSLCRRLRAQSGPSGVVIRTKSPVFDSVNRDASIYSLS